MFRHGEKREAPWTEFLPNGGQGVFKMMNHKSKLQREENEGRRGLMHMERTEELVENWVP